MLFITATDAHFTPEEMEEFREEIPNREVGERALAQMETLVNTIAAGTLSNSYFTLMVGEDTEGRVFRNVRVEGGTTFELEGDRWYAGDGVALNMDSGLRLAEAMLDEIYPA